MLSKAERTLENVHRVIEKIFTSEEKNIHVAKRLRIEAQLQLEKKQYDEA